MTRPIADLLFPPVCAGCGERLPFGGFPRPERTALCPACREKWTAARQERCGICQKEVSACVCAPQELEKAGCRAFCKLVYYRPGERDEVQNRVIYRIKDRPDRGTTEFLAGELAAGVRAWLSDGENTEGRAPFLVWLPRGRGTALEKGTDQAKELALALGRILAIPVYPMLVRRFGHGKQQKTLSPAARMKNAAKAYRCRPMEEAKGGCAILVDDIVTSGASMAAGVRLLKRAGVKRFLSVAVGSDESNRTPPARQTAFTTELDRLYARGFR